MAPQIQKEKDTNELVLEWVTEFKKKFEEKVKIQTLFLSLENKVNFEVLSLYLKQFTFQSSVQSSTHLINISNIVILCQL